MHKKIILMFLCLFLCGCTAEYNLNISSDYFDEKVSVQMPFDEFSEDEANIYYKQKIPVTAQAKEDDFYKANKNINYDAYVIDFEHQFNFEDFQKSYFMNNCYSDVEITKSENKISIKTGKIFNCIVGSDGMYVDEVTININTKLKVLKHNADNYANGTYTWVINENNYENHPVEMEINVPFDIKNSLISIKGSPNFQLYIVVLGIIIVALIIYLRIKKKEKKINKF